MSKEIIHASVRLPRSLKKQADERAKDQGFESVSGEANFSAYIRKLIKQDLEGD